MKSAVLILAALLSLGATVASADNSGATDRVDVETLSDAQLDALVSILSGLPRQ